MPLQSKIECYLDADQIYYFLIEYNNYHFAFAGYYNLKNRTFSGKKQIFTCQKVSPQCAEAPSYHYKSYKSLQQLI